MFSLSYQTEYFKKLSKFHHKNPQYLIDVIAVQRDAERKIIHDTNSLCPTNLISKNMKAEEIRRALDEGYSDGNILKSLMCMNNSEFIFPDNVGVGKSYKIRKDIIDLNLIGTNSGSVSGFAATADIQKRNATFVDNKRLFVVKTPRDPRNEENQLHEYFVGIYATNQLRSRIPNFVYVLGGFRCSPPYIEDQNLSGTGRSRKKKPIIFCQNDTKENQVMYVLYENVINSVSLNDFISGDYTIGRVKGEPCTFETFLNLFTQLIFALQMAYEAYDYTHYDLHTENILVRTLPEEIIIPYKRKNGSSVYVKTKYIATIIDLEQSHIKVNIDGKNLHFGFLYYSANTMPNRSYPGVDVYKILMFSLLHSVLGNTRGSPYSSSGDTHGIADKPFVQKNKIPNGEIFGFGRKMMSYFLNDLEYDSTGDISNATVLLHELFEDTKFSLPYFTQYDTNPEIFFDNMIYRNYPGIVNTFAVTELPSNLGGIKIYGCANTGPSGSCLPLENAFAKYTKNDFDSIANAYDYYEVMIELATRLNPDTSHLEEIIALGKKNFVPYMQFLLND